jgi:hypothetical protein
MSKAIGNNKPDMLVRIELHLWRALFNVATGRDTIFTVMETFFAQIPMDELDGLAPADREFFSICMLPITSHNVILTQPSRFFFT